MAITVTGTPASARRSAQPSPASPAPTTSDPAHAGRWSMSRRPVVEPVVQPTLAGLAAGDDRPHALPPLLDERRARAAFAVGASMCPSAVSSGRRAGDAEAALARPHPQPHRPAQVVQARRRVRGGRVEQHAPGDELALADHLLVVEVALAARRAARRHGGCGRPPSRAGARRRCVQRVSTPRCSQTASTVTSAISRNVVSLPPGDGEEPADALALAVVEQGRSRG